MAASWEQPTKPRPNRKENNNLRACLPFGLLLTALDVLQQLGLQPLDQQHQIITITPLQNLAGFPAILSKFDNASYILQLGRNLEEAMAPQHMRLCCDRRSMLIKPHHRGISYEQAQHWWCQPLSATSVPQARSPHTRR